MVLSAPPWHPPKEGVEGLLACIDVPMGKDGALSACTELSDCSSPEHELWLSQMEMALEWFLGVGKNCFESRYLW